VKAEKRAFTTEGSEKSFAGLTFFKKMAGAGKNSVLSVVAVNLPL
jgi:hypothetical protein